MITPTAKTQAEQAASDSFLTLPEAMRGISALEFQLECAVKGSFDGMQALAKDMAALRMESYGYKKLCGILLELSNVAVTKLLETPGNDALKAILRTEMAVLEKEWLALQQKAGV